MPYKYRESLYHKKVKEKEFIHLNQIKTVKFICCLQTIPSNALSISVCVGTGLFLRRVYIDITIPGVQNPHWDPWDLAILSFFKKTFQKNPDQFLYVQFNLTLS